MEPRSAAFHSAVWGCLWLGGHSDLSVHDQISMLGRDVDIAAPRIWSGFRVPPSENRALQAWSINRCSFANC